MLLFLCSAKVLGTVKGIEIIRKKRKRYRQKKKLLHKKRPVLSKDDRRKDIDTFYSQCTYSIM